jgi:hypothetical protein
VKIWWDMLINILIILNCFSTPVDLAFPSYRSSINVYLNTLNAVDFMFLVDIIITFFTSYENETMEIIDNHKLIAKNYILGWFFFDIASIFPTDYVFEIMNSDFNNGSSTYNRMTKLLRIARL